MSGVTAATFLHEMGAKIVAASDAHGAIQNLQGLDIPAVARHVGETGKISGFPEAEEITNEELLATEVDVLIPAAIGGVLTQDNAHDVRARCIVEAANNPTVPEAGEVFERREIPVLPDVLANSGGVTVRLFRVGAESTAFSLGSGPCPQRTGQDTSAEF